MERAPGDEQAEARGERSKHPAERHGGEAADEHPAPVGSVAEAPHDRCADGTGQQRGGERPLSGAEGDPEVMGDARHERRPERADDGGDHRGDHEHRLQDGGTAVGAHGCCTLSMSRPRVAVAAASSASSPSLSSPIASRSTARYWVWVASSSRRPLVGERDQHHPSVLAAARLLDEAAAVKPVDHLGGTRLGEGLGLGRARSRRAARRAAWSAARPRCARALDCPCAAAAGSAARRARASWWRRALLRRRGWWRRGPPREVYCSAMHYARQVAGPSRSG